MHIYRHRCILHKTQGIPEGKPSLSCHYMSSTYNISISSELPKYSDRCIFPQAVLAAVLENHPQLPHPLVFRLTNAQAESVLVGVREFTAPESEILVPEEVFSRIGQSEVTIQVEEVQKATFLQVKPVQFYPQVTNWKFYLESFLSKNYTTLSVTQLFGYWDPVANSAVELVVEDANEKSVIVVDTDSVLDVVPLNDIMAAQQLEQSKAISALENIPVLGDSVDIDLEPFSRVSIPKVYKLNVQEFQSKIHVVLQGDDIANVDILGGMDKFLTLDNFSWSTMTQDDQKSKVLTIDVTSDDMANFVEKHKGECFLYLVFFAWEHNAAVHVSIGDTTRETEMAPEGVQCPNCMKYIPGNLQLHELACLRKKKCICGELFNGSIPSTHWHCEICGASVHGNSTLHKMKHQKIYHQQPYHCDKCNDGITYDNLLDLVTNHKATTCPQKLHECIFCHMILPQGEETYQDRFNNLTHHESECGNKTTECFQCGKVVKSRDMASHMKMHYLDKVEQQSHPLQHCSNQVCVAIFENTSPSNDLGLCDSCYRPLYASVHDPTHVKLQNRIERKYVMQLTKGCGNGWCDNPECATGGTKMDIKSALARIKQVLFPMVVVPTLPINSGCGGDGASNRFWFCIGEGILRRKQLLMELVATNVAETLVYRAVWKYVDEALVRQWLEQNRV